MNIEISEAQWLRSWISVPISPVTFVSVASVFAVPGALRCGIPAIRATRVDPIVALRSD